MKKITEFLQKKDGLIFVIAYALSAVYALGMATPAACCKYYEPTESFYKQIMPYNNAFLILSIFGLLISAFYFVLRNHVRIIYYISNFVWTLIYGVYTVVTAVVMFMGVSFYQGKYAALPFDEMNEYWLTRSTQRISENTSVFLLGFMLAVLLLLTLVPLALVTVDKIKSRLNYEKNKRNGIANPVSFHSKEAK